MAGGSIAEAGPIWLREFFPGYFALVMGTGIIAVAAQLLRYPALSWPLFVVALVAYPVLWVILLARIVRFPRAVIADFSSHQRGPTFLTIVAANGVLGSQFVAFDTLTPLLSPLFWFSAGLWSVLVYGFLATIAVHTKKPDLERGLNGSWLLLVVATESLSVLGSLLALKTGAPGVLVFAAFAFYVLGAVLYGLLTALILLRWMFRPATSGDLTAPWLIGMGAVAIGTLAGTQLMALPERDPALLPLLHFVAPFTAVLWITSTFWFPLLAILFIWRGLRREPHRYDPSLWSAVFPLGMYSAATHDYATAARLPFLDPISEIFLWVALAVWLASFCGMWTRLLQWSRR